jgi:Tol biopolymer transport system component
MKLARKEGCAALLAALALAAAGGRAAGQVTTRVSVSSAGVQANGASPYSASISADGSAIAFYSAASNLVAGDTNGAPDVFVHSFPLGTTTRVSVDSSGAEANATSDTAAISADGRYVAFGSLASNLVPGDSNGTYDVFVRDLLTGTTVRASVDSSGAEANGPSLSPAISADGRYVAFHSQATNLAPGGTPGLYQVYLRDMATGSTQRASIDLSGVAGNNHSLAPSISANGRFVAFSSLASDLVPVDTNGQMDVFVFDAALGTTDIASVSSAGVQGNGASDSASISADGYRVAFESAADDLVSGDTNGVSDVFVRNLAIGTTIRASVDSSGAQGNDKSNAPVFSPAGRYVAFESLATNLDPADGNLVSDVFLRDLLAGTTARVSVSSGGTEANGASHAGSISSDGRFVAFLSVATNLVQVDTNAASDVFVHDLAPTGFTSLCDPGAGGVVACPCSNPPAGSARGCDNSSATGGASLAASGVAYLAQDTLVFTTSGEKPTALSVVLQGPAVIPAGTHYGQGVRCVAGALKRLYTRAAILGGVSLPDTVAGDSPVSVTSAAKGDVIQPGESRWYLVYYRDPNVLGGCPASSTFNATQSGRIAWSP